MKRIHNLIFAFILVAYALSSCQGKNEIGALVPADAVVVSYFDTKSLLQKLPYQDVKSTVLFNDFKNSRHFSDWEKNLLDDPEKSGIDLTNGLLAFVEKDSGDAFNMAVVGFVGNKSDFEAFNKNLDSSQQITTENNIHSIVLNNSAVAGWNDKNFVYVLNMQKPSTSELDLDEDNSLPLLPEGDITAAKAQIKGILNLTSGNSLAKDKRFGELLNEKGDIKVWLNSEKMVDLASTGAMAMINMNEFIKDTRSTHVINFTDGAITLQQRTYYGNKIADLVKKYKGEKITAQDFSKIPSSDVAGAMALNFKPEIIYEFIKFIGVDGLVNMFLNEDDISLADILKSFDGKFLISLSDFKVTGKDTSASLQTPVDFNLLVKAGVANKENLQKVLDMIISDAGAIVPVSNLPYLLTDKEFVYSNKKGYAEEYTKGNANQKFEWTDKLTGHAFGLYLNINKILQSLPEPKDTANAKSLQLSKTFWKDLYSSGGDIKGNSITGQTIINLQDNKTNSLKQLNEYFDGLYKLNKDKIREYKENHTDTTTVPVADSTAL